MNKQLLLTLLVVLSVLFSVSAVCASEVSVTDSYATSLVDDTSDVSVYSYAASSDISVSSDSNVDNDSSKVSLSSEEVLESENSNTLSTNTDSSELTAGAVSTKLITPDRTINIKDAIEGYDYQVILKDANGDPLPGKVVSFDFNGKTSTGITNSKGWATAKLTSDTSGTYDVKVTFKGDADYNKVSQVGSVKIIKNEVNFVAPDRTLYLDDISAGYIYPVILRDSEGNALSKKQVILTFDGKKLTETTNNRGYCYFNLSVNKEGSYGVSLRFDGDQYYYGKSCSYFKTVEVIVMKNVTFVAPDRTLYLDDISGGYSYPVLLRDSDGKALANKKVTITFNGKKLTGTTNNRGYCYFNLSVNKPGAYGVSLAFAGDKYCYSKSCSNFKTVEVIVMKNVTFIAPDRTLHVDDISGGYSYPVLLRDSDGKALANKKVTITFNGKKLTGITNSKGYCYFNIKVDKAGSYGVSFEFAGDKYCYPNLISNYRTVKVVKENTKLTWNSGTLFVSGSETFEILLTDGNGVALVNKAVKLVINSKTYSVKTDSNGFAAFDLNLNLDSKTYAVSYSFAGDNGYNSCSGSTKISVINRDVSEGYGYYLFGSDMKSVNLNTLASYGTTDLFLNYYAIEKYGKSDVESWIASANKVGIRVHIWMQTFYDGSWINPVSDGVYNKDIFNSRIAEAEEYANLKGVSGIHLDYLRYPGTAYKYSGGTEAISEFTRLVTEAVHKINPGLIVSAALMPETKDTIYYYGQDYSALSSYLDLVLPMVYKGNYKSGTSWISSTTKWYVDNSKGAKVWITLQSYKSDDDTSRLPASELNNDAKTVLNANADGVILFRYGLSNFVNFTNLDDSSEGISVSIDDILTGAVNLKAYYENNKVLPNTVTVAGQAFKTPEFLYLMSQAISQLGSSDTNPISCIYGVGGASSPSGDAINAQLMRADYLTVAKNVANYIKSNNQAPNYVSSAVGKISYTVLVDASSRILAFYRNNGNALPNYVTVLQSASNGSSDKPVSVSIDDVLTGAVSLKAYYEANKELPNTVTAAGYQFKTSEFLYLMSQAISQLGSSDTNPISCIYGVGGASSPSGDAINAQLMRADYLTVAKNVASFIKSNNQAPNYASSAVGKISYTVLVDASSRILAFYRNNGNALPNYVTVVQSASKTSEGPASVSIDDVLTGAVNLKAYYEKNNVLPGTVTVADHAFKTSEFLYLMSQTIYQLGSSNNSQITCIYGVSDASSPSGDDIDAQLFREDYLNVSMRVADYIKSYNRAPNYASSAVGKISYSMLIDASSRILAFYKNNENALPVYVTIKQDSSSYDIVSGGMNVINTITNLEPYYQSTKNCQVNNSAIKEIVTSLTSGLTTDQEKAVAIYNYVRDQISYSFYYNTRYGAVGTLNAKTGNCVDQAHLLIAMYRTAGLAARYEHGTCYFTLSGSTYGHVWTQVLIGNLWVVGDPTSNRNSFGNVINWNTNSYIHNGYYSSLPF